MTMRMSQFKNINNMIVKNTSEFHASGSIYGKTENEMNNVINNNNYDNNINNELDADEMNNGLNNFDEDDDSENDSENDSGDDDTNGEEYINTHPNDIINWRNDNYDESELEENKEEERHSCHNQVCVLGVISLIIAAGTFILSFV